jgi:CheY-like chemotaxis protein
VAGVLVVGDDLVWSSRLLSQAGLAGAESTQGVRDLEAARAALDAERTRLVLVDLSSRSFDGLAAVALAARDGRTVIAVGRHDDAEVRKRALAAGARRVYAYAKMHADGVAVLRGWLGRAA